MVVILTWLRLELRRRWRALLVLALLIAISTGTVMAALAGARRGDSTVDRLLAETVPADAVIQPNEPGFDWGLVRALPQVESIGLVGSGIYTINGVADPTDTLYKMPVDADAMQTVERPVVLAGRPADPARDDEAVVTERFAELNGLGVGDTVQFGLYRQETVDPTGVIPPPPVADGPVVTVRVVGVIRSFFFADELGGPGQILPSVGLFNRYRLNFVGKDQLGDYAALVRLRDGAAGLTAFRADLARVTGRSDIAVSGPVKEQHVRDVVRFEAVALLAFGLAALIAAVVLVGQSVVRYAAASGPELRLLRGVGMTPRQAAASAAVGPLVAALVGATAGVGAAVLASRWMPFGAAAPYEPHPGVDADWLVLGTGWLLVPALVGSVAAIAAAVAMARVGSETGGRSSAVARAAATAGLPVAVVVGTRFALERGRGRSAVPVRPALLGAVTGVVGVLAAFTVAAGVGDAAGHPERFGQNASGAVYLGYAGQEAAPAGPILAALDAEPDITGLLESRYAVGYAGEAAMKTWSYGPVGDPLPIVLTDGAPPRSDNEVVLGPTSARRLGATLGSSITLTGKATSGELRVVGLGFVPEGTSDTGDYGEGAWVTPGAYRTLFADYFEGYGAIYSFRDGVDPTAGNAHVQDVLGTIPGAEGAGVYPAPVPQRIGEIRNVQVLPVLLGVFLALLAVGAVGHALATAVRRRRHDVAVLRAVGMTRGQVRGVVFTQATLLAAVGLLFGVPLGIALGRTIWRLVAESTPLLYQPPAVAFALLLIVLAALVLFNLLAAWPSRRAVRLPVNQILRAE